MLIAGCAKSASIMFGIDPELVVALFVKMCPKYWAACGGLIQFGCALKHLQKLVDIE